MAHVLKARRVVNPGRKRRKMTAKQILHFGTKRQRAALKRRVSNAGKRSFRKSKKAAMKHFRAHGVVSKVHKAKKLPKILKRYGNPRRKRRVKNVGAIYTVTLGGNPGKKEKKSMARRKRRSSRRVVVHRRRRRAVANPVRRRRRVRRNYGTRRGRSWSSFATKRRRNPGRRRRHSYRRNPGLGVGSVSKMAKTALYIIAGAVGTRALTQMLLKDKNTGAMGYVANAVGSFVLGFAAKKVLKSEEAGNMIAIGGMTGLVLRLLQDVTPIGKYVNLQLSGMGMLGDVGMGAIVPTTFFVPLYHAPGGENIANTQLPAAVRAAMAPPASSGMRGIGSVTKGGRYTGTGRYSS